MLDLSVVSEWPLISGTSELPLEGIAIKVKGSLLDITKTSVASVTEIFLAWKILGKIFLTEDSAQREEVVQLYTQLESARPEVVKMLQNLQVDEKIKTSHIVFLVEKVVQGIKIQ